MVNPVIVTPLSGVIVIEPPLPVEAKYNLNSLLEALYAGADEALFLSVLNDKTSVTLPDTSVKLEYVPAVPDAVPQPIV